MNSNEKEGIDMLVQCEGKGSRGDCGSCYHRDVHNYSDNCNQICASYLENTHCRIHQMYMDRVWNNILSKIALEAHHEA